MADKGHEETEKLLKTLEGRVTREYKQAEKDVEAKLKDYLRRFKVKDDAKRKALKRGEITQETYDKWRLGQIMIGKRWEEMRDTLAEDYLHAHEIAQGLAYDTAIDVYALNHNYGTFIAEKGALADTSYTLYNHAAVERLIKERPDLLPDPSKDTLLKIKQGKIKRWSKQKITSAVTQGILQGEPLMDIAKRLRAVTNMNRAASIRNARTTVTNAQSAGRYDAFRRIKQMGLDPKVVWIATLDNHTRHEHRMLDGQMQEIDEPFEVEGKKILYPANTGFGDYKVPADLVYNCRCTIGVAYPGTKLYEEGLQGVDRFSRLGDMSYEEWKETRGLPNEESPQRTVNGVDISSTWVRRPGRFAFAVEDVISAQGFDGRPRVVSAEEFEKAVRAANGGKGFIAQRTYSAPTQEILDAYRQQLYEGSWYVDCSDGGATFGQGMYCAADYTGKLSPSITMEMRHYKDLGESRYETRFDAGAAREKQFQMAEREGNAVIARGGSNEEAFKVFDSIRSMREREWAEMYAPELLPTKGVSYIETMTLDPSAKTITYKEIADKMAGNKSYQETYGDVGALAAALGYDAIIADDRMSSGSYIVILNRTKVIIKDDR